MAKFKKKPVVVEAEQFVLFEHNKSAQYVDILGIKFPVYRDSVQNRMPYLLIPTLEGNMRADHLDWIIKGIKGEIYPCKPDVFEKTYDAVKE